MMQSNQTPTSKSPFLHWIARQCFHWMFLRISNSKLVNNDPSVWRVLDGVDSWKWILKMFWMFISWSNLIVISKLVSLWKMSIVASVKKTCLIAPNHLSSHRMLPGLYNHYSLFQIRFTHSLTWCWAWRTSNGAGHPLTTPSCSLSLTKLTQHQSCSQCKMFSPSYKVGSVLTWMMANT